MSDLLGQLGDLFRAVFMTGHWFGFLQPDVWRDVLNRPGVFTASLVFLNLIVFTETGLLVGFLLPGDSLLVTVGIVASESGWSLPLLIGTLSASAIVGDTVGYWIGYKAGPAIFSRPDGRLFKQKYLADAHAFYEKYGGRTIIYARFVPIIRTFAPVIAGAARMEYRKFLAYNVVGGVAWVASMLVAGYYVVAVADRVLRPLLGNPEFTVAKHIEKLAILVIVLSVLPIVYNVAKSYLGRGAGRSEETSPPGPLSQKERGGPRVEAQGHGVPPKPLAQ